MARDRQRSGGVASGQAPAGRRQAAAHAVLRLQRHAGNRAVAGVLARDPKRKPPPITNRRTALEAMTRDAGFPAARVKVIGEALKAFTDAQVRHMARSGVRFWGPTGLPPGYEGVVPVPEFDASAHGGVKAAYASTARIIRLPGATSMEHMVHELAHAWDNVRGRKTKNVAELMKLDNKHEAVAAEANAHANHAWSRSDTKHTVKVNGKLEKLTVREIFTRLRQQLRDQQFGTPGTAPGYSRRNVEEFYAEAYAVFHVGDKEQKARLMVESPEMWELVDKDR